jgi:hypothetical protein
MPPPLLQREQVLHRDLPFLRPVEEMLSKLRWEIQATESSASVGESHVSQFFAKALCFNRISGFLEAVREFEKYSSPLLVGRDRVRQEIDDRAIRAHVPSRRDAVELLGDLSRK